MRNLGIEGRRSRAYGDRQTLRPESGVRTRWVKTKALYYPLVTGKVGSNLKVLQGFSEMFHKTVKKLTPERRTKH